MRATLTDDGCAYEGDETPSAGMFTVEVENQTEYVGAFALAAIAEGSTIEGDLEPFVEKARQQWQQTRTLPDLPPYYEQVVRGAAQAGEVTSLPADVPAGTYALMCFVDDPPSGGLTSPRSSTYRISELRPPVIVYAVVDDALSPDFPLGVAHGRPARSTPLSR